MEKLSCSLEDYIEEIYSQVLKNGNAKVTAIAKSLNVRKASVTGALNTLSEKKLVNYTPYSPITLTAKGEEIAKQVLEKHENIAKFFTDVMGLDETESAEIACKMEHIVSEKLFENMLKLTDFINNSKINTKDLY